MAWQLVNLDPFALYPPYNIEALEENTYRISMAVAGFSEAELDITSLENELLVKGSKAEQKEKRRYLHQGIAERNFERKFQLADYVNVVSAEVENGLLHIVLRKDLPEAKKPRQIEVVNRKLQS